MPWTVNNPPAVAKNWTLPQKRRCVRAANRTLAFGKSDKDAVFACIAAAGKSREKQGPDEYDRVSEDAANTFQAIMALYLAGSISLSILRSRFEQELERHFVALMLLGLGGKSPTDANFEQLDIFLQREMVYFDNFIRQLELGEVTPDRAMFRAGLYGYTRHVYVNYTVDDFVARGMPVLPGEDCLGGDLCKCSLEVRDNGESVLVFWVLSPETESCSVCIGHAVDSPYEIVKV